MRIAEFKTVAASNPLVSFPIELRQGTPFVGALGSVLVLLPTAAALLVPFVLLGQHLVSEAEARAQLLDHPGSSLQIALALGLWALLFAMPTHRLLTRMFAKRVIEIDGTSVTVAERGLFAGSSWSEPLASYLGVAHHVRASVSGTRHELILVHPDADKSLLLATAERFTDTEVARVARFLGTVEVPARELYRLRAPNLPRPRVPGLAGARA